MATQKNKLSVEKKKPVKLSKSQVRRVPEFAELYKIVGKYSLREEAYATTVQVYLKLKKKP